MNDWSKTFAGHARQARTWRQTHRPNCDIDARALLAGRSPLLTGEGTTPLTVAIAQQPFATTRPAQVAPRRAAGLDGPGF